MRRTIAALSLLLLVPAGTGAQQPFTPFGAIPTLESYLEALRQQAAIPGMSAALVKDGVVVWEKGFGFQNIPSRVRATPDTPYLVGDISGTLSAVLLLQCVEQRRLDLDMPVRNYGGGDQNATLRQLLSHTAPENAAEPFVYSLERYDRLTSVMEWCAPQPYRKSVAHRLLNRLAMKDSVPGTDLQNPALELPDGLFDSGDLDRYRRVLGRMAVPYRVDTRGRAEPTELAPAGITAASGLVTTVRDLARFDAALGTSLLLLDDTRALAWTPATLGRNTPSPMGLGWFVQSHRGQRVVWHFGLVPNAWSSLIVKLPAQNLTFILLANSDGLSAPFQLSQGDLTRSLFATLFLRLAT